MDNNSSKVVLVTGGTGFLGIHCILKLLRQGYTVRTTLRSMERKQEVLSMLRSGGVNNADSLSFYIAHLTKDEGWQEAICGCDYILHVASPFPSEMPRDEDDLIVTAREGSLRILKLQEQME